MTDIVPAEDIERIVGVKRHALIHYGRAVSAEQRFYILHSKSCVDRLPDLRRCSFSRTLDNGIDPKDWDGHEDAAVRLGMKNPTGRRSDERLIPFAGTAAR